MRKDSGQTVRGNLIVILIICNNNHSSNFFGTVLYKIMDHGVYFFQRTAQLSCVHFLFHMIIDWINQRKRKERKWGIFYFSIYYKKRENPLKVSWQQAVSGINFNHWAKIGLFLSLALKENNPYKAFLLFGLVWFYLLEKETFLDNYFI